MVKTRRCQKAGEWRQNATASAYEVGQTLAMTEQEAEALAARLTRIWDGLTTFVVNVEASVGLAQFVAPVSQDVELRVNCLRGHMDYSLQKIGSDLCILWCDDRANPRSFLPYVWDWTPVELLRPLQSQWMDFFRRGCWLSGCPIEASAHEKMEWMQGFSREELQAWNLEM